MGWIKRYQATVKLPGAVQVVPEAEGMKRLRKENKQWQSENKLLKKVTAYFAKNSL
jgi:transposase-like protein